MTRRMDVNKVLEWTVVNYSRLNQVWLDGCLSVGGEGEVNG